jgi:hypothetical protein
VIKSLPSLFYFLELLHTTHMTLHTDLMPYFSVVNGYYGRVESHDALICMKTHILVSIPLLLSIKFLKRKIGQGIIKSK